MPKKRQVHENLVKFHCRLPAETKQRLQDYADNRDETAARVLADLINLHIPDINSKIILQVLEHETDNQVDLEEWLRNHE
jgi:predicted DNA-binding protein